MARRVYRNGEAVSMSPRAFDVLVMLLERRGQVVAKNELLETVWAGQFVEENNLSVQISALRKLFGEQKGNHSLIVTVPGRGYTFVADVVSRRQNEAIVIENRSVSEITVETSPATATLTAPALKRSPRSAAIAFAGAAAVILIAAFAGGSYLYSKRSADSDGGKTRRIRQLTSTGNVSIAAISPDGKLFAYVTKERDSQSLLLGNTAGGNHIMLRPEAKVNYTRLQFTADGSHVVYSVHESDANGTFRIPAFGGPELKLTDRADQFALSASGDRIAFIRTEEKGGTHDVMTAAADGSDERIIAGFSKAEVPVGGSISWSPDGKRLALGVVRDADIYRHDLVILETDGQYERIPLEGWREMTRTRWMSDGISIAITAVAENSWLSVPKYDVLLFNTADRSISRMTNDLSSYGPSLDTAASGQILSVEHRQRNNIWVAPAGDLSAHRQVTKGSFGRYDGLWGLDWTADGRIIFTLSEGTSQVLGTINPDGSGLKQLTPPGAIDSLVVAAEDTDTVVFHSNVNGDFDIWKMRADGSERRQLTFGRRNYQPFISRDGRWVYYKSWEKNGGKGELRRVPIDGGDSEKVTDRETSWVSFSPDGKYFAAGYVTDKERLAVFSADTGEIVRQFELQPTWNLSLGTRWTPDSKGIVFRDNYSGYWMQPADGGSAERLVGLPDEKLYNFAWSKDGSYFAFVRGEEKRDVVLFE